MGFECSKRQYINQVNEPHSTRQAQLNDTSPIPADVQYSGVWRVKVRDTGRNAQFSQVAPLARNYTVLWGAQES